MRWVLWGAELSPFALKVEAMLRFADVPHRWMPRDGNFREALRYQRRLQKLVKRRLSLTWPKMSDLDEFPLVPFLFGPGGENLYDSSAIAAWLDAHVPGRAASGRLLPQRDPALLFVTRLVDEALDEVGLYLVHHNRWVVSARDNGAGRRLAAEMKPLAGPAAALLTLRFPRRQVRRLPYLFSVADPDDRRFDDLPAGLRPPSRPGFPPTHTLLDDLFGQLLAAVEPIFAARPFLFGERFTVADASVYGQIGMNRTDPSAWEMIRTAAPSTAAWIERLHQGDFTGHRADGALALDTEVGALLSWVGRIFLPLMHQNRAAFVRHREGGVVRFNEAAFDASEALYDGDLEGRAFRSVAKSFQVRVWSDLCEEWQILSRPHRHSLDSRIPNAEFLAELPVH